MLVGDHIDVDCGALRLGNRGSGRAADTTARGRLRSRLQRKDVDRFQPVRPQSLQQRIVVATRRSARGQGNWAGGQAGAPPHRSGRHLPYAERVRDIDPDAARTNEFSHGSLVLGRINRFDRFRKYSPQTKLTPARSSIA